MEQRQAAEDLAAERQLRADLAERALRMLEAQGTGCQQDELDGDTAGNR